MFAIRLMDILKEIANSELSAEKARQRLYNSINLQNRSLFDSLQIHLKGYITGEDVAQYVKDEGYHVDLEEASLFVQLYDSDSDEKLSFCEFSNFLVPVSRHITTYLFYTPNELKNEIAQFIASEIRIHKKIRQSILRLISQREWSTFSNFALIDKEGKGQLDLINLSLFIEGSNTKLDYDGIFALLRRLNKGVFGPASYSTFLLWFGEPCDKNVKNEEYQASEEIRKEISLYLRDANTKSTNQLKEQISMRETNFEQLPPTIVNNLTPVAMKIETLPPKTDSNTIFERKISDLRNFTNRESNRYLREPSEKLETETEKYHLKVNFNRLTVNDALIQFHSGQTHAKDLNTVSSALITTPASRVLNHPFMSTERFRQSKGASEQSFLTAKKSPFQKIVDRASIKCCQLKLEDTLKDTFSRNDSTLHR